MSDSASAASPTAAAPAIWGHVDVARAASGHTTDSPDPAGAVGAADSLVPRPST
ncbi:hypothetical protein ABZW44_39570 [Streptomyces mirabilis]|uniref:hypothetical protein n=1 Tax=Streptomyces mirabilis TaxID=68239 RepID=UPI0033B31F8E